MSKLNYSRRHASGSPPLRRVELAVHPNSMAARKWRRQTWTSWRPEDATSQVGGAVASDAAQT
jgi:hypothetical protein